MRRDPEALRKAVADMGYEAVIVAESDLEFTYDAAAARLLVENEDARAPAALRAALEARFRSVAPFKDCLDALWERLERQAGATLAGPAWIRAEPVGDPEERRWSGYASPALGLISRTLFEEWDRLIGLHAVMRCWNFLSLAEHELIRRAMGGREAVPGLGDWTRAIEHGAGYALLWRGAAVVLVWPEVRVDGRGLLHREDGPAARWTGVGARNLYCWHGTVVPEKLILRPESVDRADIAAETNSEVSRAIAERLGWERYLAQAAAVLIDAWADPGSACRYELYDFKSRKGERMPRLLKMQSPPLNDGTRPEYVEPVPPGLKSCAAARRWQFRRPDGLWPAIEECNAEPALAFEREY